jgi:hypothetical protein
VIRLHGAVRTGCSGLFIGFLLSVDALIVR